MSHRSLRFCSFFFNLFFSLFFRLDDSFLCHFKYNVEYSKFFISIILISTVLYIWFFLKFLFYFYFLKFIYLFIYLIFGCIGSSLLHVGFLQLLRAGATPHCGAQASHCGSLSTTRHAGLSSHGTRASAVVAHGLYSAGSAVVAHGCSHSMACGILPDQGSNSHPLSRQVDS